MLTQKIKKKVRRPWPFSYMYLKVKLRKSPKYSYKTVRLKDFKLKKWKDDI